MDVRCSPQILRHFEWSLNLWARAYGSYVTVAVTAVTSSRKKGQRLSGATPLRLSARIKSDSAKALVLLRPQTQYLLTTEIDIFNPTKTRAAVPLKCQGPKTISAINHHRTRPVDPWQIPTGAQRFWARGRLEDCATCTTNTSMRRSGAAPTPTTLSESVASHRHGCTERTDQESGTPFNL